MLIRLESGLVVAITCHQDFEKVITHDMKNATANGLCVTI